MFYEEGNTNTLDLDVNVTVSFIYLFLFINWSISHCFSRESPVILSSRPPKINNIHSYVTTLMSHIHLQSPPSIICQIAGCVSETQAVTDWYRCQKSTYV